MLQCELLALLDTEVEFFQLGEGLVGDETGAVAAQVDVEVVRDHDLAVGSHAQIEFDAVHRQFERLFEGDQSVFRIAAGPAAMGDDLRFHSPISLFLFEHNVLFS